MPADLSPSCKSKSQPTEQKTSLLFTCVDHSVLEKLKKWKLLCDEIPFCVHEPVETTNEPDRVSHNVNAGVQGTPDSSLFNEIKVLSYSLSLPMIRWQRCASLGQSSNVMLHCALKLAGGTHKTVFFIQKTHKTVFFVQRTKTFQIKIRLSPQNHNYKSHSDSNTPQSHYRRR